MFEVKPVIIFGANYLGKLALDAFESNRNVVYCFLDDDKELHGKEFKDVSVLSNSDDRGYLKFIGNKCDAFVASDDNKYRKSIIDSLISDRKVMPVNAVHSDANVSVSSELGHGNFIGLGARINAFSKIGNHNIIQSGVVIDAEVIVENLVQIGIGSNIAANVHLEEEVFIGSGVTVVSGIKIGKRARIGAGSVVVSDVKAGETVFGNPASKVK